MALVCRFVESYPAQVICRNPRCSTLTTSTSERRALKDGINKLNLSEDELRRLTIIHLPKEFLNAFIAVLDKSTLPIPVAVYGHNQIVNLKLRAELLPDEKKDRLLCQLFKDFRRKLGIIDLGIWGACQCPEVAFALMYLATGTFMFRIGSCTDQAGVLSCRGLRYHDVGKKPGRASAQYSHWFQNRYVHLVQYLEDQADLQSAVSAIRSGVPNGRPFHVVITSPRQIALVKFDKDAIWCIGPLPLMASGPEDVAVRNFVSLIVFFRDPDLVFRPLDQESKTLTTRSDERLTIRSDLLGSWNELTDTLNESSRPIVFVTLDPSTFMLAYSLKIFYLHVCLSADNASPPFRRAKEEFAPGQERF